jgi:hypothetical protein
LPTLLPTHIQSDICLLQSSSPGLVTWTINNAPSSSESASPSSSQSGGRSTVSGWIFGPITKLQKELQSATAENERLNDEDIQLTAAQRNLNDWRFNSLPSNIDDAQRLYREWLFELARQCGFSGSGFEVTPGSRSAQKEFSTVSVDVKKAEVDLSGLARFLYLFDQAGMMHRIAALKIDSPGAQGNPRLVVSFTAEGMSVAGSEDRRELLARTPLATALTESSTSLKATPSELFPTAEGFEPFWIRIDREMLKVEAITDEGWKVLRFCRYQAHCTCRQQSHRTVSR